MKPQMLKINVVDECPHTVAKGHLYLPHNIIGALAGAVQDRQEWMALFKGTRSPNGLMVRVTGIKVPPHYRSLSNVELMKHEPLTPDIIGVVHSHHSFSACFSLTDYDELNTRFPLSLVIAQPSRSSTDECYSLGFDYAVEGKVTLPCGSVGNINYVIVPVPLPKNWAPVPRANFDKPDTDKMGDCDSSTSKQTKSHEEITTKCGLLFTRALPTVFGTYDDLIMPRVEKVAKPRPIVQYPKQNQYFGNWQRRDYEKQTDLASHINGWSESHGYRDNQPSSDQWGFWDKKGRYHRFDD